LEEDLTRNVKLVIDKLFVVISLFLNVSLHRDVTIRTQCVFMLSKFTNK